MLKDLIYWNEIVQIATDITHLSITLQKPIVDQFFEENPDVEPADTDPDFLTDLCHSQYSDDEISEWNATETKTSEIRTKYNLSQEEVALDIWRSIEFTEMSPETSATMH